MATFAPPHPEKLGRLVELSVQIAEFAPTVEAPAKRALEAAEEELTVAMTRSDSPNRERRDAALETLRLAGEERARLAAEYMRANCALWACEPGPRTIQAEIRSLVVATTEWLDKLQVRLRFAWFGFRRRALAAES